MASKFELSLSPDYVSDWTVQDGIREFLQNAFDQEVKIADNEATVGYDSYTGVLRISNKNSSLEKSSLLLGATTKAGDATTIGNFGEGYKIALLVLIRAGKNVTIYNYGKREVWTARFVKSRRYGADVLTIFVDSAFPWKKVPDNNLTIEIDNISVDEYNSTCERTLRLQDYYNRYTTSKGDILLDTEHQGKVFVNGLLVTEVDKLSLGYSFKPAHLKIGRDRNLVNDFDIAWATSQMWLEHPGNECAQLVLDKALDVRYVDNHILSTLHGQVIESVATALYNNDVDNEDDEDDEDKDTRPVLYASSYSYDSMRVYNDVANIKIVDDKIESIVKLSTHYKERMSQIEELAANAKATLSGRERYNNWKALYAKHLGSKAKAELDEIIDLLEGK